MPTDKYLLDHYRDYLKQHGFEVATATTGVGVWNGFVGALWTCWSGTVDPWGWGDGVLATMHEESDIPLVPVIVLTYGRDRSVLYRLAPFRLTTTR